MNNMLPDAMEVIEWVVKQLPPKIKRSKLSTRGVRQDALSLRYKGAEIFRVNYDPPISGDYHARPNAPRWIMLESNLLGGEKNHYIGMFDADTDRRFWVAHINSFEDLNRYIPLIVRSCETMDSFVNPPIAAEKKVIIDELIKMIADFFDKDVSQFTYYDSGFSTKKIVCSISYNAPYDYMPEYSAGPLYVEFYPTGLMYVVFIDNLPEKMVEKYSLKKHSNLGQYRYYFSIHKVEELKGYSAVIKQACRRMIKFVDKEVEEILQERLDPDYKYIKMIREQRGERDSFE